MRYFLNSFQGRAPRLGLFARQSYTNAAPGRLLATEAAFRCIALDEGGREKGRDYQDRKMIGRDDDLRSIARGHLRDLSAREQFHE
jgi:hypothetical protein